MAKNSEEAKAKSKSLHGDPSVDESAREEEHANEGEATEAARDRAEEHNVDLSKLEGTGKDGSITVQDVEAAAGDPDNQKPVYAYVCVNPERFDINTESVRLSTRFGDRVFRRNSQSVMVPMEEYEELAKLKSPQGEQYIKKEGEL